MALKVMYENKDEIPAGLEEHYVEKDDQWILQAEGLKTDADLSALRKSLDASRKEAKEYKTRLKNFEGIDPEDYRKKLDEYEELKIKAEKSQPDDKKLEQLLEVRVNAAKRPVETENQTLKQRLAELEGENNILKTEKVKGKIETSLRKLAQEANVRSTAMADVLLYAEQFELNQETDQVVQKGTGIPITDWFSEIKVQRDHWFPPSEGGGVKGSKPSAGAGQVNPWKEGSINYTKQAELMNKNPELAKVLMRAAGVSN
jgi:hypothetical protein